MIKDILNHYIDLMDSGYAIQFTIMFIITLIFVGAFLVIAKPSISKSISGWNISFGGSVLNSNQVYAKKDGEQLYVLNEYKRSMLNTMTRNIVEQIVIEKNIGLPFDQMKHVEGILSNIEGVLTKNFEELYKSIGDNKNINIVDKPEYRNYRSLVSGGLNNVVKPYFRQVFMLNHIPDPKSVEFIEKAESEAREVYGRMIEHMNNSYCSCTIPRNDLIESLEKSKFYEAHVLDGTKDALAYAYNSTRKVSKIIQELESERIRKEQIIIYGSEEEIRELNEEVDTQESVAPITHKRMQGEF